MIRNPRKHGELERVLEMKNALKNRFKDINPQTMRIWKEYREQQRESTRKWTLKNKGRVKENCKRYYIRNKKEIIEKKIKEYEENKK